MKSAQSPHIPAPGSKPGLTDIRWLAGYTARGLWELVRARIIFARMPAKAIPDRNRAAKSNADIQSVVAPAALARITYVLPRISDRLPWRSDCMVQAIAGQNWLSQMGDASEIQIGVENPKDGEFGAHAWLLHRDSEGREGIVTGGDIDRYHLILSDSGVNHEPQTDHQTGDSGEN